MHLLQPGIGNPDTVLPVPLTHLHEQVHLVTEAQGNCFSAGQHPLHHGDYQDDLSEHHHLQNSRKISSSHPNVDIQVK